MGARALPQLLTRSAERFPDYPAVVMDGRTVTYAELEAMANRFARALASHGVNRGSRVVLWLPKSPEAIVALYGTMKAGAAYVSVDAGAPAARLAFIARDCKAAALVTLSSRAAPLEREFADGTAVATVVYADGAPDPPALGKARVLSWPHLAAESSQLPENPADERDLAYILYTSGSTGEPKGVMISHSASLSFVDWAGDTFEIAHEDRLANHAGFHFDLSTFDLYCAARAGATVYPVPPRLTAFPAALAKHWSLDRLTVWYATPSTLVLLLAHGNLAEVDLTSLRVVLFAGEVFPVKHLRRLMELAPQARFANLYGPTETNVCTWYEVESVPENETPLPIGRICPNCEGWLLGDDGRPVPDGEVGELWIGGGTLMRGYWGRPELTASTLRQIVLASGDTRLAYKTGDLVRRRDDGNLIYVGRRDHQVKTRGYRVELGEIEVALSRHPAVDQAIMLAVPDEEIGNRLRAVVVLKPGHDQNEAELKRHCAEFLPRYMVPEAIGFMTELPRTASEKVDRPALLRIALGYDNKVTRQRY
jgi:L-proline---[L-prolyl-carrier protein] ligase